MGADLYLNPPPPPDPLEQIKRRLEWQQQEISALRKAIDVKDREINRLETLLLGRNTR